MNFTPIGLDIGDIFLHLPDFVGAAGTNRLAALTAISVILAMLAYFLFKNERGAFKAIPYVLICVFIAFMVIFLDSTKDPSSPPPPQPSPVGIGETTAKLKRALNMQGCNAGSDDFIDFQAASAVMIYNLSKPSNCSTLESISEMSNLNTIADNLKKILDCGAATVCGYTPSPGFYRERNNGCWYFTGKDRQHDEYSVWDGACDGQRRVTGDGVMKFYYPSGARNPDVIRTVGSYYDGRLSGVAHVKNNVGHVSCQIYVKGKLTGFC